MTQRFSSICQDISQTEKPLRLVGYEVEGIKYWVASGRFDLTAEQIASIYKLRWDIETFFAWWKRHLKVYHLISRSPHGLMIQMLAELITYLLLAIYCDEEHGEPVSIKRVRQLQDKFHNEFRTAECHGSDARNQDNNSHFQTPCKCLTGHYCENGEYRITQKVNKPRLVQEFTSLMSKFKHLTDDNLYVLQTMVDKQQRTIQALCNATEQQAA